MGGEQILGFKDTGNYWIPVGEACDSCGAIEPVGACARCGTFDGRHRFKCCVEGVDYVKVATVVA